MLGRLLVLTALLAFPAELPAQVRPIPPTASSPAGGLGNTGLGDMGLGGAPQPLAPSPLRDALWYQRAVWGTWYWYTGPHLIERWHEYRRMIQKSDGGPSVSDPRAFFVDDRLIGTNALMTPLGFKVVSDQAVFEDARAIYGRYFPEDPQARAAFERFLGRIREDSLPQRSTHLRKHVLYALRDASVQPPERLAAFFDGSYTDRRQRLLEKFQASRQSEVLAAFEETSGEAVLAVNRDLLPGRRVGGVVLHGSFASGAAGPGSDMDVQAIVEDGKSQTGERLVAELQRRWSERGMTNPISGFSYALPASRGLMQRMHPESYLVFSPYPGFAQALRRPEPPSPVLRPDRRRTVWESALKRLYAGLMRLMLAAHHASARLRYF